ncbi:hypothetical protein ACMAZF_01235 [Psychrobium sp. nBUS_13]|uniref:hypothetical protein n=1 Tax=Psychrobium sp. nBUS_13 TaxID=3395319 RepID=UPI003EC02147
MLRKDSASHLVIVGLLLVEAAVNKYLADAGVLSFNNFYLVSALMVNAVIVGGVVLHITLDLRHTDNAYVVYALMVIQILLYLLIHQVRVETVTSDDGVIWLLNAHTLVMGATNIAVAVSLMLKGSNSWLYFVYLHWLQAWRRCISFVKER